ncbi:MAG TPA: NnrU family protein [Acidocella sp.]|nr:MAG: NnrU family protein [Acidocella sp. 20-61-6]HQT47480.1 NnrU family protein [Acidocella sp.]
MPLLFFGLLIFLGLHSLRIYAKDWRQAQIARLGVGRWRSIFGLLSLAGLVLIILGFGAARAHPVPLYTPPLPYLNALLSLLAFLCVGAAYVPRNHIKQTLGHPMLAGVALWAFGHLLATGMLYDTVLFGAFLLWSATDFLTSRQRDRAAGTHYPPGALPGDLKVLAIGILAWAAFAFWLHQRLIGVNPMT